jgi:glycogen operon protein
MSRHRVGEGFAEPLGASLAAEGINFAVFSSRATRIEVCLFDEAGRHEIARIVLPGRTGDIFHGHVAGLGAGQRYGLRAHGPYAPEQGDRFNAHKLLLDPHATLIDRPFRLHESMFGYRRGDDAADLSFDTNDSAAVMPKAIIEASTAPALPSRPRHAWADSILYELHVRGFSRGNTSIAPANRGTFAGLGDPASIAHLSRLGVTAVEIMPVAAWLDERHLPPLGLGNYWGYNPVAWCAPAPHLAPGGWDEIRDCVARLHEAGIEVIVDVVLNHSGEGDALGPTVSLRGIDNAAYYRLQPGNERAYVDDAGCGNILSCDRAPVVRLAMDALRTWAMRAGIDGFRLDLATTLGRRPEGFDPQAPLLAAITQDPILRDLKLIAEPWDIGPGGYQMGAFPAAFAEWNDRYRDDIRRFWRGDPGLRGALATRLSGSSDLFHAKRRPSRGINFITAHDGFTLGDLVSHTGKRNEANGEHNRDGTDANFAWSHGVEGASEDAGVAAARLRDQRNLLATLLLSRGTPMLSMGAESGHSQQGNNNAYAQDNAISWLDWEQADEGLIDFTHRLIAFRRSSLALTQDRFLTGNAVDASGVPDVAWCDGQGRPLDENGWNEAGNPTLVAVLSTAGTDPDRVTIIIHRGNEETRPILSACRDGHVWQRVIDTADPSPAGSDFTPGESPAPVAPRSVTAFREIVQTGRSGGRAGVDHEVLDRLAQAAGIAPDWWDVAGHRHRVGDDTKKALLDAMALEAGSTWQARASLYHLGETRDRRLLPEVVTVWEGAPLQVRLARGSASGALVMLREDGSRHVYALKTVPCEPCRIEGRDGRVIAGLCVTLPAQDIGRHFLWLDTQPDLLCHLTVAPRQCHLPAELARGERRFGISAQLYGLRGNADEDGIGSFTTLGEFAARAAEAGAALVGLNPMHALFADDRERASPYSPSDRRFLDPVYLKVRAISGSETVDEASWSAASFVDYPGVWRRKQRGLEQAFAAFRTRRSREPMSTEVGEFAAFVVDGGMALRDFAVFEAIAETQRGKPWFAWPAGLQNPRGPQVSRFAAERRERVDFHLFLQWQCERQLAAAAETARSRGLSIGFYRDLAVGAAPDGAEIWANATVFAEGVSIGAPPDPFSATGQVWGLPPFNPLALAATGFSEFSTLLGRNMRHAGALRIDHVMALERAFWVPEGASGTEGAYVAYPREHLLAQLTLKSRQSNCLVVGEDLGTVPEGFREQLTEADILSYRVLLFERDGEEFRPAETFPQKAVACVATHDLPTFAGWQRGADLTEAANLGLVPADELPARQAERDRERAALARGLGIEATTAREEFGVAAHQAIAASPCLLALVQAEDLAGATEGVNLPGTDRERPNWRRRLPVRLSELFTRPEARAILAAMRRRSTPIKP